jgi:hypothetical protein
LASVFSIKEKNLGAFRARLRHLRNLGLPNIPKRGSGNVFIYKTKDLFAASAALSLQALGCAPAMSVKLATFAVEYLPLVESTASDVFLVMTSVPAPPEANRLEDTVRPVRVKAHEKAPPGSAKVIAPRGVRDFMLVAAPLGGDNNTHAFIIEGAEAAKDFIVKAKVLGSSIINISERFRALPTES